MQAAGMQQSVGEHMTAVRVCAKLDFVNRHEIRANFQRHGFDRANPILGAVRNNPFLARDQCNAIEATNGLDPVIDLSRQQAQRQTNDACAVGKHPFNGVMCFACIRGAKHRDTARP